MGILKVIKNKSIYLIFSLFLICCLMFGFSAEAKTYTNTKCGYAIDLPDYIVVRDNLGLYDLVADGGDNYGSDCLHNNREGLEITISSEPFYKYNVTEDDLQQIIYDWKQKALRFGVKTDYRVIKSRSGHLCIGTFNVRMGDVVDIGITAFWYGNKISVCVGSYFDSNSWKDALNILDSFRCIAH